jgi:class I fructose-bisphosphate aldolase
MGKVKRPTLDDLDLSLGKRTRLHRLLYEFGPANGTLLFLPIDQGLEHGPRDFRAAGVNSQSIDPEFQLRLALDGGYSGIVFHIGIAQKYMKQYAGKVPLVLKLNGKTEIPSDREALSPQTATVEDAVRLGADAIGYTLYVGSPAQVEDIVQFMAIRAEAERYGMPVIVWAYPRGEAIEGKGGRDSFYAVDYAARVANELGADVVKVNFPKIDPAKDKAAPKPYNDLQITAEEAFAKVVEAAGKTLVLVSGGEKAEDEDVLGKARASMEAGATGLIFGRNLWQRSYEEAMHMTRQIKEMMQEYGA